MPFVYNGMPFVYNGRNNELQSFVDKCCETPDTCDPIS